MRAHVLSIDVCAIIASMSKEGLTLGGDFPPNDHSMAFGEVERHGLALHELKTLVVGGIDAVNQAAAAHLMRIEEVP